MTGYNPNRNPAGAEGGTGGQFASGDSMREEAGQIDAFDDVEEFSVDEFGVNYDIARVPGWNRRWNITLTSEDGDQHVIVYDGDTTPPSMNDVMAGAAKNARLVEDGYEGFCERLGYNPDDDLYYEYEAALLEARGLHRVLGDEGYGAMVHGDPDRGCDLPESENEFDRDVRDAVHHDNDERYRQEVQRINSEEEDFDDRIHELTRLHGYHISDDYAVPAVNHDGWQHIHHEVELTDPDSGETIQLTYQSGRQDPPPTASDVIAHHVLGLQEAREYDWDANAFCRDIGYNKEDNAYDIVETHRRYESLRDFEAWLGDRADDYCDD